MKRRSAALAGLLALVSCAPYPLNPAPPAQSVAAPPPQAAPTQPPPAAALPAPPAQYPPPRPAASASDQCGAGQLQRLIGRPRTEIPIPLEPSRRRVACTTCPVTQDYNPARLNFLYDAQSGLIREIRCG